MPEEKQRKSMRTSELDKMINKLQNTRRKEGKVMLKPVVKASEFTKYGFKRCRELPKLAECYSWNHGAGRGNNE